MGQNREVLQKLCCIFSLKEALWMPFAKALNSVSPSIKPQASSLELNKAGRVRKGENTPIGEGYRLKKQMERGGKY